MKRLILGCGFLGKPLADSWLADGDEVHVVTRKPARAKGFSAAGFKPIVADITNIESLEGLPQVDTVVIAVGMDRSVYESVFAVYVDGLKNVLKKLSDSSDQIGQLIYVSSTGVYGNFDGGWVDESSPTDPQREGGKACLAAEQLLRDSAFASRTTIVRMAGLYGNERVPTRAIVESKKWDKLSPEGYLNLIHVVDAVNVIREIAQQSILGELFLASDSNPSLRRDYYQFIADQFGLPPIPWDKTKPVDPQSRSSSSKRISNKKLLQQTQIELQFPDYRSGLRQTFSN